MIRRQNHAVGELVINRFIILLILAIVSVHSAAPKTSIVLVLTDDLGHGDVEYNAKPNTFGARTPELNAMASASTAFQMTNFHSTSSVCSPTRASLLSGRFPDRECVSGANAAFDLPGRMYKDKYPFRVDMASIARDAKLAGYTTGFFGKWHIGPMDTRNPGVMGFDTWIASGGNMPTYDPGCLEMEARCEAKRASFKTPGPDQCYVTRKKPRQYSSLFTRKECYLGHYGNPRRFSPAWTAEMYENKSSTLGWQMSQVPRKVMMSDYMVDRFESFIEQVPASQPFFAYIWMHSPHHPFIASPKIAEECRTGIACTGNATGVNKKVDYFGVIVGLDRALGRIRRLLRTVGRSDSTLLIFTSDNGPEDNTKDAAGSPWPYRGFKGTILEGSHRVPGLIEWPSMIKANAKVNALASTVDLYETFRDIFELENPSLNFSALNTRPSDGISLLPLLLSKDPANWERPTSYFTCQPMIWSSTRFCNTFAYYSGKWKMTGTRLDRPGKYIQSAMHLFDVAADPLETNNLAKKHPEIVSQMFPNAIDIVWSIQNEFHAFCHVPAPRNGRRLEVAAE